MTLGLVPALKTAACRDFLASVTDEPALGKCRAGSGVLSALAEIESCTFGLTGHENRSFIIAGVIQYVPSYEAGGQSALMDGRSPGMTR